MLDIHWSIEVPFEQRVVEREIPTQPGVYQILQDGTYARYKGSTRVLKIGKSDGSLRQEITNHFSRHAAANRLSRVRTQPDVHVSVVFSVLPQQLTTEVEAVLLCKFEDEHWELPILNPQRGYRRDADAHYRS